MTSSGSKGRTQAWCSNFGLIEKSTGKSRGSEKVRPQDKAPKQISSRPKRKKPAGKDKGPESLKSTKDDGQRKYSRKDSFIGLDHVRRRDVLRVNFTQGGGTAPCRQRSEGILAFSNIGPWLRGKPIRSGCERRRVSKVENNSRAG